MFKKLASVFLVLVVLSSVVSPALAASIEQKACPSYSKVITEKSKIAVVDVIGIEKNEILAKTLKNKDVRKLTCVLEKKGYKPKLAKTRVIKIYTKYGTATLVIVPFDTGSRANIAGIIYLISSDRVKAYAIELKEMKNAIHKKIYYFDSKGNLQVTESTQGFLSCLWACIGWEIPACALVCGACPESLLSCLACAACVGKGACCVGKCGKQEWGEPFCAAIDVLCQLGYSWACAVKLGCEGYC